MPKIETLELKTDGQWFPHRECKAFGGKIVAWIELFPMPGRPGKWCSVPGVSRWVNVVDPA